MSVAEIGAGKGELAIRLAGKLGPGGRFFSNELDPDRVREVRSTVGNRKLTNVTVIQGTVEDTGLPAECCDAIFLRSVYHHFTHPSEMNRSLLRSLRPGGVLAIVDFAPRWYLRPWRPKGVPKNRGGHGIPQQVLIDEVTKAGLKLQNTRDWPGKMYCVVFRKPS